MGFNACFDICGVMAININIYEKILCFVGVLTKGRVGDYNSSSYYIIDLREIG